MILGIFIFPEWTGAYVFSTEAATRFSLSFLIVGVISYSLESLRNYYYQQLETEHNKLRLALDEVKTLSGLLPICSTCKKIRDDQGYWSQIEAYIGAHSDAEFTHGICPECAHKLYPDIFPEPGEL